MFRTWKLRWWETCCLPTWICGRVFISFAEEDILCYIGLSWVLQDIYHLWSPPRMASSGPPPTLPQQCSRHFQVPCFESYNISPEFSLRFLIHSTLRSCLILNQHLTSEAHLIQLQLMITNHLTVTRGSNEIQQVACLLALLTVWQILFFPTHMTCFLKEVVSFLKESEVSWRSLHTHHKYSVTSVAHISLLFSPPCPALWKDSQIIN